MLLPVARHAPRAPNTSAHTKSKRILRALPHPRCRGGSRSPQCGQNSRDFPTGSPQCKHGCSPDGAERGGADIEVVAICWGLAFGRFDEPFYDEARRNGAHHGAEKTTPDPQRIARKQTGAFGTGEHSHARAETAQTQRRQSQNRRAQRGDHRNPDRALLKRCAAIGTQRRFRFGQGRAAIRASFVRGVGFGNGCHDKGLIIWNLVVAAYSERVVSVCAFDDAAAP